MKKFLALCLLALATAAQAGTWSTASWTGDATTNITSPQTQWAYHFGSATAATVNGVSVPGIATATVSNANLDASFGTVVASSNNNISSLGGSSSSVLAGSFVHQGSPGTVTVKGLTVGLVYTVSFFGVGYENPGVALFTFASGSDTMLNVDESAFGLGNGIRVDYTFTAVATTRLFTLANNNASYTWHQHAIARRLLTTTPTVTTPTSASITGITATLGGNVTDDGLATISERGVVYSISTTNSDPLISGNGVTKVPLGSGTLGVFTLPVASLATGTTYAFKAYATNPQGTGYSSVSTFTTLSSNATLSALTLNSGTLDPVFAGGTTSYTANVSLNTSTIRVTPTVAQTNATVKVNAVSVGSGLPSGSIPLDIGSNTISIVVTAQDGITTQTYDLEVIRLTLPTVATPTKTSITGTTATLGGEVIDDGLATITERGVIFAISSTNSDPIIGGNGVTKVPVGSGTLGVFTVAASSLAPGSDYTYKAYATNSQGSSYSSADTFVTLSNNANLSGLLLSLGTLSPAFSSGITSYTASVSNTTTSITVKPTLAQANATQTVNTIAVASAASSSPISLSIGTNTISIATTAQDGLTTKTYTVVVTRLPAPEINVTGNNVTISSGDFLPSSTDDTDFGTLRTAPGTTRTRTFTIQNLGTADLLLNRTPKVSIAGPDAADFEITAQPTSPITVAAGSSTFAVTFTPSAAGSRLAFLSIGSNDADEATYTFAIKGTGKWIGDDFADAQLLTGSSATASATNADATSEVGEPYHGTDATGMAISSMWWVWTAPSNGSATVSLLASDYDSVLSIYTGSALGSLTKIVANNDFNGTSQSQATFTAVSGTTYRIAVDGLNGQTGSIGLQLELLNVPNVNITVSPDSMAEGAAGTLAYTFTRNGDATSAFTANFSVGGTATFATDYTQSGAASFSATAGTVAFAANQTTATVLIDPIADSGIEANETVELTLTSGTGYVVGSTPSATATINDDDSSTVLSSNTNPSVFGQGITLSATVSALSGTRTGLVTFKEGATTLGTATPIAGVATLSLSSLAVGTHSLTAEYAGDATANASVSSAISQVVNKAATSTQLASSRNPSTFAASVTFTATVTTNSPGAGVPSGSVTFKDGSTTLGSGTLDDAGMATLSTAALSTGTHSITAEYSGSSSQVASTSAATPQVVNPALTLTPATLPTGTVGVLYNQALTASNGSGLRSLSATSFSAGGTGLSAPVAGFNTLTLAGTATAAGTVTFTALVTDEGGGTLSVPCSVQIDNVPPKLSITNATTNEDTPTSSGLVVTRSVVDATHVKITAITNGTLFQNDGSTAIASNSFITYAQANAGLKFSPAANFFGAGSFSLQAATSGSDAGLVGSIVAANITVTPIADTPAISGATTNEDTQTTTGLVVTRSAADGAEVTHVKITAITNGTLFQNDGSTAIAASDFITLAQAAAGLKFSPAANFNGSASITLQASTSAVDAGLGGSPATATITVLAVNDAPSFTKGADQIRPFASTTAQTLAGWATALSKGPADEATQSLTFNIVSNSNPALFTTLPSIASDGTLSYTPTGTVGSATLTVTLSDDGGTALGGANTSASQSFTITVEPLPDYTVVVSATSIVVTDIGGHADTLVISEPSASSIQFSAVGRTFRINAAALSSGDSGSISLAGITAITAHAGNGNDVINVGGFTSPMPALTINGDGGDDAISLNGNLSFLANASLDLDLGNDPGTAGIDTVRVAAGASILASGTGSITMKVSGDIALATGSTLQTANGGITLHAARATGSAAGIDINGAQVRSTGTGVVEVIGSGILGSGSMVGIAVRNAGSISGGSSGTTSISGTGGTGPGSNVGVLVTGAGSFITTAGSHLAITGTTTATGATNDNNGISIKASASVSATGAGRITLIGTGAQATGVRNYGVYLDTASKVTSENGDISVSGTARSTAGDFPIGIIALNSAEIASTGSGGIALVGIGAGTTSSSSADGILLITTNGSVGPRIATNGGLIRVEGRAGASATGYGFEAGAGANLVGGPIQVFANQFVIDTGANPSTLNAGGDNVSLAPVSSAIAVVLGGTDSTTQLGLTDAELDRISCGTLVISTSSTPGETLTVSAPISRSSTAAISNELANTNLQLHSSGDLIVDQPINLGGGSLQLFSGSPLGLIKPRANSVDITAATTTLAAGTLGLTLNGTVVNTLYDQLNIIGSLDVTGSRLALNGSLIPAAGTSYTLINNDSNDAIIGTFVGLPQGTIFSFNGIDMRISYTGGSGNDVTIEPSNTAPTISDVASSSTLEDTATTAIAITIGDGESAASLLTLSATSSNATLVPNLPGSFTFGGTGANRTVIITPAANQFGTATITLTVNDGNLTASDTFELTVAPIADTPSITNASTNEDTQTATGLVVTRNIADSTEVTHFKITAITNGTLFQNNGTSVIANNDFITFAQANAGLKFTPSANSISNGSITIQASTSNADVGLGGSAVIATITVNAIADTPSITSATTNEDTQTTTGLVVSRNVADSNEVTHFKVTAITNGTLFQANGSTAIANNEFITFAQANAGLKFSPTANSISNGSITIQASTSNLDAGLGGSTVVANITVNAIADTPAITSATTDEDIQTSSGLVVSRNAADGAEVTHFKITAITNGTLFQANGSNTIANGDFITFAQASAGLKFTPNANSISNGSITIQASTSAFDAGLGGSTVTANITVNAIADTPAITSATTNEDTQTTTGLVVSRNVADSTEVTHFKITAISNGTLFQNNGSTAIANGDFITFAQANAGLKFSPTANFFGNGSITIQASTSAFDSGLGGSTVATNITVNAIADTPAITSATTNEDTQTTTGLVVSRNAVDGAEVTHFKITGITNGTLFQNDGSTAIANNGFITFAQASAGLKFTPNANSISNGSITIQASTSNLDAGLGGSTVTANITVNAIADTPSITSTTTNEDTQTTTGLVVSRNTADSTEVTHFKITAITNGTLFQNDGATAIANGDFITFAQANAGLKFTPAANFFGTGSLTIQASTSAFDAGLGGSTVMANISVNAIADTPAITSATTNEDTQTTTGLVVSRSVADGAEVTHFKITGITNGTLFQNDGSMAIANNGFITFAQASAGLKFTPSSNIIGSGSFIIQASTSAFDTGLGGITVIATISLNSIADTPSITNAATNEDTQTTTGLVITRNVADGPEVTHFKVTAITNGTLFQNDGTTAIANNAFITFAQANAGLKFTPNVDYNGTGSVTIQASISNLDTGLGGSTVTALITINSVNDVPSFTKGADQVRPFANTTAQTVTGWATAISKGPTYESAQSLSFNITNNSNAGLFTVAPSIASDGTLTYKPAGTVGTATLTVTLNDDGGTAFGGVDTSAAQTFTITVSDAPDYVVTTTGSSLIISDSSGNSDSLLLSEPTAGSLTISVAGRSFSVNQDYSSVDDSGAISLSGITSITVNAASGSDTIQVGPFTSPLPSLTINGGTGDDTVRFAGNIDFATDASLDLDMQNDDAAPGQDHIRILADAHLIFAGTGGLLAKSNSFTMESGATLATTAGDVLITGNAGAALPGVLLSNASSLTATAGRIILTGASDDAAGNKAIVLNGTASITSPSITLIADSIAIDPVGATLDTGIAGSVTLRQQTAATPINLGSADTTTALGFTDAELDRITAATLAIGDTNSGLITISTVISPASYKTLALGHDVVFTAASGLDSDVGPTADVYEKITVIGTATLAPGATLHLASVGGYTAARAASFTFLDNDGSDAIIGSFTGPSLIDFLGSALIADRSYVGGDGNDLVITNALPVPAPLLSTSLGAGVVNPSTGLIEQTVRVTNDSAVNIDGVRLTLTNLVAPYTLQNRTHPSLPFIEVCTPLAARESMDIYVAIYTANRILPNWLPNYQATPLVALALSPTTQSLPSAATSYAITVTTAGSWSVVESLPWVSVSTLDGSSNGYLTVTVQANTSLLPRSGVIKIGCREHQITQAGVLPPHIDAMPSNYDTIVGDDFRLVLPVLNLPATFKTLGMPPGLKLDQTTGVIFGQPTTAGFYALSIFGRNASGVTNTVHFSITVAPLKSGVVGTFQGLIQRSASVYVGPLPSMGARIQLTVASTGAITGKITDGGTAKAITGQLHTTLATADSPAATVRLPATTVSPEYILNLVLSHASNDLTGTIALASSTAIPAAIEAWRNSWHVKAPAQLASAYKIRHNFAIENQGTVGPQGFGLGSFSVAETTGALTIVGKLPDGSALLCSTFIGASGQVLLYQSLYGNKGSCLGKLIVDSKTTDLADNTLAGALTWSKPASAPAAKDTLYPEGFGPIPLSVEGGSYTPPAAGLRVMNLPLVPAPGLNATLTFSDGGLLNAFGQDLRISASGLVNTATLPLYNAQLVPNPNPRQVAITTFTAATGGFVGRFTLPGTTAATNRIAPFCGQIVTTSSGPIGLGYFLLPSIPTGTQTVSTSPKLSGSVELQGVTP